MGSCHTKTQTDGYGSRKTDKEISNKILIDRATNRKTKERLMVLCGTSFVGKTTFMKQLENIFQHNNKHDDIQNAVYEIRKNCVDTIIALSEITDDEKTMQSLNELSATNNNDLQNISNIIFNKWNDKSIEHEYRDRYLPQTNINYNDWILYDNMDYFLNKIHEIMNINYVPTDKDIVLSKSTSLKCKSSMFYKKSVQNDGFIVVDYGDFNNYSSIYDHKTFEIMFHTAGVVMFIASLTDHCNYIEYDNDELENSMIMSLDYFEMICNSRYCRRAEFVVLLNKVDIFREQLKRGITMTEFSEQLQTDHKWNGPDYICIKLPLIVTYIARNIQKEMNDYIIIPVEIVELMQKYVYSVADNFKHLNNDEYFNICYEESIKYIQQEYTLRYEKSSRDIHYQGVYFHVTNATDLPYTTKVFEDIHHHIVIRSMSMVS